jgi:hypothetical protein
MKTIFLTFTTSIVTYAIITLPTIVIPIMYGYSMLLAIAFGFMAWLVYLIIFMATKSLSIISEIKWLTLIVAIPICVAIGYHLIEVFNIWKNVWNADYLMLFPLAAVISGWIGLYKTKNEIETIFNPSTIENYIIY